MSMRIATLTALGLALGLGGAGAANAAPITMNLYSGFFDNLTNNITPLTTPFETASVGAIDFQSHGLKSSSTLWPTADKVFAAIFTANITATGKSQTFTLTSDDASYLYIDGVYKGGLPGPHDTSTSPVTITTTLSAGTHSLRLAYDNLLPTDAVINLGLTSGVSYTSTVPLPASLPMFGVALIGLSAVGYGVKRGKRATAA